MTSLHSSLVLGDQIEFWRIAAAAGLTAADIKMLNKHPEALGDMVIAMRTHPCFELEHGVFRPVDELLEITQDQISAWTHGKRDFSSFEWIGSQNPLAYTDDPEVAVVLVPTLNTLEETAEFLWEWIKDGQENSWRSDHALFDPDHLRMLQARGTFRPNTLEYVRIKLNAHQGKKPVDVRGADSAGFEVFACCAQHPERVKAMNGGDRPYLNVSGLELHVSGGRPWQGMLRVRFARGGRGVGLFRSWCGSAYEGWSSPVRVPD